MRYKGYKLGNTVKVIGGGIATSTDYDNIQEGLQILLSTRRGDRAGMPDYGCSVIERVFDPNDILQMSIIEDDIRETVSAWEPRINLTDVVLTPNEDTFEIDVQVGYEVVDLGEGYEQLDEIQ